MDYHVILIEYGKPTHHWFYIDHLQALAQLRHLTEAYLEVNDVSATIVKAGHSDRDLSVYELLQRLIISPEPYHLD